MLVGGQGDLQWGVAMPQSLLLYPICSIISPASPSISLFCWGLGHAGTCGWQVFQATEAGI